MYLFQLSVVCKRWKFGAVENTVIMQQNQNCKLEIADAPSERRIAWRLGRKPHLGEKIQNEKAPRRKISVWKHLGEERKDHFEWERPEEIRHSGEKT